MNDYPKEVLLQIITHHPNLRMQSFLKQQVELGRMTYFRFVDLKKVANGSTPKDIDADQAVEFNTIQEVEGETVVYAVPTLDGKIIEHREFHCLDVQYSLNNDYEDQRFRKCQTP